MHCIHVVTPTRWINRTKARVLTNPVKLAVVMLLKIEEIRMLTTGIRQGFKPKPRVRKAHSAG